MEFALVAPAFLMMMFGTFNVGQMFYGQSILEGAVQQAARSSALETGDTTEADEKVRSRVMVVLPGADITSSRVSYYDFADIGRPERWDDEDGNGTCNDGEAYTDENLSGDWDSDVGVNGNGGAGDVVIYEVTVTYEPLFLMPLAPDSWNSASLKATSIKKNQPFGNQLEYGSGAGTCE